MGALAERRLPSGNTCPPHGSVGVTCFVPQAAQSPPWSLVASLSSRGPKAGLRYKGQY